MSRIEKAYVLHNRTINLQTTCNAVAKPSHSIRGCHVAKYNCWNGYVTTALIVSFINRRFISFGPYFIAVVLRADRAQVGKYRICVSSIDGSGAY